MTTPESVHRLGWSGLFALLWFAVAMVTSLFFYGLGYNLVFLFASVTCALAGMGLLGPNHLMRRANELSLASMLALLSLVALVLLQLVFTVSPDTSASPSWILASVPIWFLIVLALPNPRALFLLGGGVVALIAVVAFVRFCVWGQRAYDPLVDASNLGALIYLVWIPTIHWLLVRYWYAPTQSRQPVLLPMLALLTFIALAVVFATASRAAQLLCCAALFGWVLLALIRRQSLVPVLVVIASAGLAFGLFILRAPELSAAMSADSDLGGSGELRWLLWESTWQAIQANGLFGSGVFTFSLLYPLYRSVADQSSAGLYVHNDYLQFALEGGVWLAVPLLVFAATVGWRSLLGLHRQLPLAQLKTLGGYWALAALLVHASVNFVFYTLALGIATGIVAGFAISHRFVGDRSGVADAPSQPLDMRQVVGWVTGFGFALVALAYFALDVASYSVLSGQPGFVFTDRYRESPARQLEFAQLAEELNERRGLPVVAQAMLSEGLQRKNPESKFRAEQTLTLYRRALEKDSLNPSAYVSFAKHLIRTRTAGDEHPAELLQQALRIDPTHLPAALTLARFHDAIGQSPKAFEQLREQMLWLDYYSLRRPRAALGLMAELKRRGEALGETEFLQALAQTRQRITNRNAQPLNPVWFMTWRARQAATAVPESSEAPPAR